jgi:hypothetical protein
MSIVDERRRIGLVTAGRLDPPLIPATETANLAQFGPGLETIGKPMKLSRDR